MLNAINKAAIAELQQVLVCIPGLLFAVLAGSRAEGSETEQSDWDIAVQWQHCDALVRIGKHEDLRRALAKKLNLTEEKIDLIDLKNTNLTMKALVTEEGYLLVANDELSWAKFLGKTWRELEDYYWDKEHAA
jgi:predicted nucleotidyltransferase